MAQQPVPQPPVVGPLAGDGSTASPEEVASDKSNPKPTPKTDADRERRSFVTEDVEKPYRSGPAGPDGDDDPDDRGSEYCPDDSSGPVRP